MMNDQREEKTRSSSAIVVGGHGGDHHEAVSERLRPMLCQRALFDHGATVVNDLLEKAQIHFDQGRHRLALGAFGRALQLAQRRHDDKGEGGPGGEGDARSQARALLGLAQSNRELLDFTRSREQYNSVLRYARDLNSPQLEGRAYTGIGNIEFMNTEYGSAQTMYKRALVAANQINDEPAMVAAYVNLANAYACQSQCDLALSYFDKAKRLLLEMMADEKNTSTTTTDDTTKRQHQHALNLANIALNMGNIVQESTNDFVRAEGLYSEALENATAVNAMGIIKGYYCNMANMCSNKMEDHVRGYDMRMKLNQILSLEHGRQNETQCGICLEEMDEREGRAKNDNRSALATSNSNTTGTYNNNDENTSPSYNIIECCQSESSSATKCRRGKEENVHIIGGCWHTFHKECLLNWLRASAPRRRCPTCSTRI